MTETNEQKYMSIKVPLQYREPIEKFIEVTGDADTRVIEVEGPHHVEIKGMKSATLYWHEGSNCITFKLGGKWFMV